MPVEVLPAAMQQPSVEWRMSDGPVGETRCVGMKRDVAVVVELADRNPQPGVPLSTTTASPARVHSSPTRIPVRDNSSIRSRSNGTATRGGGGESGGLGVVEEPGQRVIGDRDIDREDRHPHRRVGPVPLDDPIEE